MRCSLLMNQKIDLEKEEKIFTYSHDKLNYPEGVIEHKFVISLKDLEGTPLHPDFDWSSVNIEEDEECCDCCCHYED